MKKSFLLFILLTLSHITLPMCPTYRITELITRNFTSEEKKEFDEKQSSLIANSSLITADQGENNSRNRRSFDELFDDYDPCKWLLRNGLTELFRFCKDLYRTAEVLDSALNDSEIYRKKD